MSDDFDPNMGNSEENEDFAQGMSDAVKSNPVSQMIKNSGKKLAKSGASVAKNVAKQALSVIWKMIASTLIAILPYLLGFLAIGLIVAGSYYYLFDSRGTQQEYTYDYANTTQQSNGDFSVANQNNLSPENNEVKTFYDYNQYMSYWQALDKNGKPLTRPITRDELVQTQASDKPVHDYYNRENMFELPTNLLFSLDEYMYNSKFRYPEQFRQPVNFDGNTLTLKNLTNVQGSIDVQSKTYDPKTGALVQGKMTNSVADYGLGTIYTYKEATQTDTIEGFITSYDVHSVVSEAGPNNTTVLVDVVTPQQAHIPYNVVMKGYPKTVDLLDKAITFVGEFQFNYHIEKVKFEDLMQGYDSADDGAPNEPYTTIKWGTYVDVSGNTHTLYAYRNGAVYQTMPVPDPTTAHVQGDQYLNDYLTFFEANVPESVMQGFDFSKRVDQSYLDNNGNNNQTGGGTNVGTGNGNVISLSLRYLNIVEQYANQFGIDPYLVCAQIAQESGGNPTVNQGGLMQIDPPDTRTVQAKDKTGQMQSFTITGSERLNPDDAIHWAVIYDASLYQEFGDDPLKMIQAYNLGSGTLQWIEYHYPSDWNSPNWMSHIEEARDAIFDSSSAGDINYIPHVLAYYQGPTDWKSRLNNPSLLQQFMNGLESVVGSVADSVLNLFPHTYTTTEPHFSYQFYASNDEISWILQMVPTMNNETLFSDTTHTSLLFWQQGYAQALATVNMSKSNLLKVIPNMNSYSSPLLSVSNPVITEDYGTITNMEGNELHEGISISADTGTPVNAITNGVVSVADNNDPNISYGQYVVVKDSDGTTSLFAHLNEIDVKVGQTVTQGQVIGKVGQTGNATAPHLYFELDKDSVPVNPHYIVSKT